MRKVIFLLSFSFNFLIGCNQEEANLNNVFFDVTSFTEKQIEMLEKSNPQVSKKTRINEEKEDFTTSDIDWSKELELLKQTDINKAAFQLSYIEEKTPSSILYRLKEGEKLPVTSLEIYKDSMGKVEKITSHISTDNYLYKSEKDIHLTFKNEQLQTYGISGWQELFIGSKKEFEIEGTVL